MLDGAGKGVMARVGGHSVAIGNDRLLADVCEGGGMSTAAAHLQEQWSSKGARSLWASMACPLGIDDWKLGVMLSFSDAIDTCTCSYMHTHTRTHIHIHTCMHARFMHATHTYSYLHTFARTHARTRTPRRTCTYSCQSLIPTPSLAHTSRQTGPHMLASCLQHLLSAPEASHHTSQRSASSLSTFFATL